MLPVFSANFELDYTKAGRPQPRSGVSAAANTRNILNVEDGLKSNV